jgi:PAS domain-containing protein
VVGADGFEEPGGVGLSDVGGVEGEDFRDVVGVEFGEGVLEGGQGGGGGFEDGEGFGGGFDSTLPAVDRLHGGEEIDAGRELPFDERCANLSRLSVSGKVQRTRRMSLMPLLNTGIPQPATPSVKSGFLEKLVARLDRVEHGEVQQIVTRLIREKGFLEKVFEALQEGVILLDPNGNIDFVNQAACRFFGLDAERATGEPLVLADPRAGLEVDRATRPHDQPGPRGVLPGKPVFEFLSGAD